MKFDDIKQNNRFRAEFGNVDYYMIADKLSCDGEFWDFSYFLVDTPPNERAGIYRVRNSNLNNGIAKYMISCPDVDELLSI